MNSFMKPALALGLVSAFALAVATPSEARNGRNAAAIGAGVAGFAVGAAIGSAAAANNSYYYGERYGYDQRYGYDRGYAYAPAPVYGYAPGPTYYGADSYAYQPGVTQYNRRDPSSYYAPGGSYGPHSNTGWQNRERSLSAGD